MVPPSTRVLSRLNNGGLMMCLAVLLLIAPFLPLGRLEPLYRFWWIEALLTLWFL